MMQIPAIKKLGSYLVDAGLVTLAQIDVALNDQEFMDDMRIGDILVTRGWIKQQTLDFVIDKVVDPEQQSVTASTRIPEPSPATIAHARSLDGSRVIEILKPQRTYTVGDVTTPSDPGYVNDRKPLSSVSNDDDDMNWAG
jgi:hypothetical protein